MSVHVMVAIFDADGLTSTEKLVALAYAEHGHDDGSEARAGIERICQYTALSRRTVQTTLQSLLAKKVLYIDRPATNKRPTCYRFLLTPDGKNLIMAGGATVAPQSGSAVDTAGGATDDVQGCNSRTQTVKEPSEPSSLLSDESKGRAKRSLEARAAVIYDTYPRKEDRAKAIAKIIAQLRKGESDQSLLAAVAAYAATKIDSEPKFIKLAATFFNESWREWVPTSVARSQKVPDFKEAEVEKRREESAAPPKNFAKDIRAQLTGSKK